MREVWVRYTSIGKGGIESWYGHPGDCLILDYGVRIKALDRADSYTTIPWHRIYSVEEVA